MGNGVGLFRQCNFVRRANRRLNLAPATPQRHCRRGRATHERNERWVPLRHERQAELRHDHSDRNAISLHFSDHHRDDAALRANGARARSGSPWLLDGCVCRRFACRVDLSHRAGPGQARTADDRLRAHRQRRDFWFIARSKFQRRHRNARLELVRPGDKLRPGQHHRAGTGTGSPARSRLGRLHVEFRRPDANRRTRRDELVRLHRNAFGARYRRDNLRDRHRICPRARPQGMLAARNDKSGTNHTDTFGSRDDLMLSFSTAWNSGRHKAGDEMLREIKVEFGFDRVELGPGIRISLMPGIQKMFEAGEVTFSSLHNFCPLPVEVLHASPDCYQFSTPWGTEAERAVKQTFPTIDFAERLGAPFVVLHCGEVRMNPITDELIALVKSGEQFSRHYVRKKINAVKKREAAAPAHLRVVKESLKRITDYAAQKNVRLGVEGRRGYEEIPSEKELPALLDELNAPHVGYWHDFGHIQIKENLGFVDHEEWLRQIGGRAFGCHVQDCIWPAQDHQAPFAGSVALEKLVPLLSPDCVFAWEMSPRRTADEIRLSVSRWKERFGE